VKIHGDMPLDLRITAPERNQHAQRQQFTLGKIDAATRDVIPKAVGREIGCMCI
jgi:hypothetical protein